MVQCCIINELLQDLSDVAKMNTKLGQSIVLVAEALVLREGLCQALNQGYNQIKYRGDSKILIDSINCLISVLWRIKFLVKEILHFATACSSISFKHLHQEANFLADAVNAVGHFTGFNSCMGSLSSFKCHVCLLSRSVRSWLL
ncbi:hypothetical protein RchiOBHm_Chr7g0218671 [Rosa chinensis]|uniref:RNase H type-1 domain-containing protein n=1 Tax=Rosa chinensis TaxID=74649 RepID=A0A2P6PCC5_ROSCH|nr:hypothetical protein RchiOBHm_Chr7g0218671 [Rosa chinensis]